MRKYRGTAHCGIELMGFEFFATIDFTYTPGRPATWCKRIGTWDPPDPPEWEIDRIWLERDEPGPDFTFPHYPKWELTGEMLYLIAEHEKVSQAVCETTDLEEAT